MSDIIRTSSHNLSHLTLWRNVAVNTDFLKCVAEYCVNLKELDLSDTKTKDSGMIPILLSCSQLTKLVLCDTAISCETLEIISEKENCQITYLDLSLLHNVTSESIENCVSNCQKLTHLVINESDEILDSSLEVFTMCCQNLRNISIKLCHCVTDEGVAGVVTELDDLEILDITGCLSVTPRFKMWLGDHTSCVTYY